MKIENLFLSWVLVLCVSGNLAEASDGGILSVGVNRTCAIDHEGVKCWGDNSEGQTNIPPLKSPTAVSVGDGHVCAIDNEGVKCWGNNNYGQIKVPSLKNPISISAGRLDTCAIDDEGVKCWGANWKERPAFRNPISVSYGRSSACAIDDEDVKCWGATISQGNGYANNPYIKNPFAISVGTANICAIGDDGVTCWGSNAYGQTQVPPLKYPTSISVGHGHVCAIDDEGVKCWGSNGYGQTKVPSLKNPFSISVRENSSCAVDDEGIKCWGNNSDGQTKVPPFENKFPPFPSFNKLENFLDNLTQWSTPVRSFFFNSLSPFVEDNLKSTGASLAQDRSVLAARYILTALLRTAIETGDSSIYIRNIIPSFRSRMKIINKQTGIQGLDQVKDGSLQRKAALKIMQASLSTMTEFLTVEDKAHIRDVIKLIGLAMTDVLNTQNIMNALTAIDTNEAIIDKLSHSSKTQFLVLTLQTAQQWLKAKIQ